MIQVSRLNGSHFYINPMMIEFFEETPDIVITLVNGKKYVVKEKQEELNKKIVDFYISVGGLMSNMQTHYDIIAKNEED